MNAVNAKQSLKTWSEPAVILISKDVVKSGAVVIFEGPGTKSAAS